MEVGDIDVVISEKATRARDKAEGAALQDRLAYCDCGKNDNQGESELNEVVTVREQVRQGDRSALNQRVPVMSWSSTTTLTMHEISRSTRSRSTRLAFQESGEAAPRARGGASGQHNIFDK